MRQTLDIRIGQQVSLTPQLQQAIRLLQLSQLELSTEIQQKLDNNIMLESEESSDSEPSEETPPEGNAEVYDLFQNEQSASHQSPDHSKTRDWQDFHHHTEIDLQSHLSWQLNLAHLSDAEKLMGQVIIDAINENGYLEQSFDEILETYRQASSETSTDASAKTLESMISSVLKIIQQFEPLGVG
ncbi:MAG: hypothetical protein ACKOAD_07995, partial [Gammaproteobacteria bacterium]